VKAIAKRLHRLEDQFGPADGKPRERFRLVVRSAGEMLGSESATCRRTLCPDGTLMELIEMSATHARDLSQEELNRWVATFPVVTL
jgi:hypothetical protein